MIQKLCTSKNDQEVKDKNFLNAESLGIEEEEKNQALVETQAPVTKRHFAHLELIEPVGFMAPPVPNHPPQAI